MIEKCGVQPAVGEIFVSVRLDVVCPYVDFADLFKQFLSEAFLESPDLLAPAVLKGLY